MSKYQLPFGTAFLALLLALVYSSFELRSIQQFSYFSGKQNPPQRVELPTPRAWVFQPLTEFISVRPAKPSVRENQRKNSPQREEKKEKPKLNKVV